MTEPLATVLETVDIMRLLPHRYPFLLVDRIVDIRGDEYGVGLKAVTANEPHFTGHFPDRPVMPGVLMIEGMAQTAGAIIAHLHRRPANTVLFLTVDKAKFRRPVVPGDLLEYFVEKKARRRNMWWFRGEAKVAGQIAAEAEVGAMIADA